MGKKMITIPYDEYIELTNSDRAKIIIENKKIKTVIKEYKTIMVLLLLGFITISLILAFK